MINSWRWCWISLAGAMAMLSAVGCDVVQFARSVQYQTAPTSEKVEPEYATLEKNKAVVYVWAKPEALWDYPQMRLDIAAHLSAYLDENVPELEIVPAPQVEKYIKSLSTMAPDPADVGRHFRADKVVHVSVYKFSLRDPGMSQFYRGRISASVVVLDLSSDDGTVKRVPLEDVVTVVPEEGLLGLHNTTAEQVRDMSYREFTTATGRKFHEWEREIH